MGLQDTIFDTRADIEENNCNHNTLARFDEIITVLEQFQARTLKCEMELLEIKKAALTFSSLFGGR